MNAHDHGQREEIYLAELFAKKESHRRIKFFSMHPGWADTPGVQTSLPAFHAKFKDSLRTMDEGADTINYLAISDEVMRTSKATSGEKKGKRKRSDEGEGKEEPEIDDPYNGKFFFDREVVSPFLTSTRTQSSDEEVEELWQLCLKMTQLKEDEDD